ncbi:MAG: peroxiredoxin [Pseudomonadales bacterium]
MIGVGDRAPDFTLPDHTGAEVSLAALTAAGDFILYFYPADFTPVCTAEACAYRDNFAGLAEVGLAIVGISPQSVDSHRRFVERYELPFPLLADAGGKVIRAYGVAGPLGFGVRRATFLIGADGIVKSRVVADFLVRSHLNLIRQTIDARRGG